MNLRSAHHLMILCTSWMVGFNLASAQEQQDDFYEEPLPVSGAPAQDYVPTPAGWLHKTCVYKMPDNGGSIEHKDNKNIWL